MTEQNVVDVIIVTEQLELVDFVEKALKQHHIINTHQANQVTDIKRILDFDEIELIIVDDAEGTLAIGSVYDVVKELQLNIPVLQLVTDNNKTTFGALMKDGASIVCPKNDVAALEANVNLLLNYSDNHHKVIRDTAIINNYRDKFEELYQGLADPICFLHDGVFVDCNTAFLRAFEVESKEKLEELTIMQFVPPKYQTELKGYLRKATRRDLTANPIVFSLQTLSGSEVEYSIMSKPAKLGDENVVQVYMRTTQKGGGAVGDVGLYDETTGLANKEQMGFFLKHKSEEFNTRGGSGILAYILISNYRDVWGTDGLSEAEKFISATAMFIRQYTSSQTEISRYTDDGILLFIPKLDEQEAEETLRQLVRGLDNVTPKGMGRMVEPVCYIGLANFGKGDNYLSLISQLFRTARSVMLSGSARVSMPSATEVAKKDTKRLTLVKNALRKEQMKLAFQPIVSFSNDSQLRYADHIGLFDGEGNLLDIELMLGVAERYQLAHHIDKWKVTKLLDRLLETSSEERQSIQIFISVSMDSLKTPLFVTWLMEQMEHTGLDGKHFVFELSVDNIINAYTGAIHFAELVKENGSKVAISRIGAFSKENSRIIDEIQPDIIKLDMREIDTLDAIEEKEMMEDILDKAETCQATLIAENVQSSAQLARLWPYGIMLAQGKALAEPLDDMNFVFAEFYLV